MPLGGQHDDAALVGPHFAAVEQNEIAEPLEERSLELDDLLEGFECVAGEPEHELIAHDRREPFAGF